MSDQAEKENLDFQKDIAYEVQEWKDALRSLVDYQGKDQAKQLLTAVLKEACQLNLRELHQHVPYTNTLTTVEEKKLSSKDKLMFQKLLSILRWNAAMIVIKAGKAFPELGGHIATYASIAVLYEIGFNYFFKGRTKTHLGDLVYFQGHSSPGIYARAFLEGYLTEEQLTHFRQEVKGKGISSYPHPWLMPTFWQFPTVSMGLGAMQAIYQARFLKYLANRGLLDENDRKVWLFCGDGEMDEPESVGALTLPAREQLDNLILVINCNLQRLDGPVRGNGSIVRELASLFKGAGWFVIHLLWGALWDKLLAQDTDGLLRERMESCVDGEFQNYVVRGPAYFREHFFGQHPKLAALVDDYSDKDLQELLHDRGGHDPDKVYSAYQMAASHKGQPVVILAKTIKGYGMGEAGESKNVAHQSKKMSMEELKVFQERFAVPVDPNTLSFCKPNKNSPEMKYLQSCRAALGGYVPRRSSEARQLSIPELAYFSSLLEGFGNREISTTMAFVRLLSLLLRVNEIKSHIVPIVPDESRTFGMEGLFRQLGIYAPSGQNYSPEDKSQVMYYKEDESGQLLQEGINEAGAFCSWIAAATSYSTNALPMIPFYIYYSMFGFQRIGDFAWAASDMRARGFLLGATAGRTTLSGEGLQHQDGHNLILASMIPTCISYDPTYAYELAVIIQDGLKRMYRDQEDIYYYITLMNENYAQPPMPKGVEEGILKGMYLLQSSKKKKRDKLYVRLLGCGAILREVLSAADLLEKEGIDSEVWSVTSFTELRREALAVERQACFDITSGQSFSYVEACLGSKEAPVIAATDYVRLLADQIRPFIKAPYYVLGTDGFGRSDTRCNLREFFEVSAGYVAYTAVYALWKAGKLPKSKVEALKKTYGIVSDKPNPFYV